MALIFRCGVSPGLKERHDQLFCELVDSSSCYGCYKELCGFFQKYCKTSDRILTAVCALSDCNRESLIEDLYDAGYHSVVGVDSSGSYIKSSRERNKEKRPEMHFLEGHVLNVDVDDESFNVLIDRGELDRLHKDCSSSQTTDSNITEYFEVVQRILKVGGRFICFSFATEDILDKLLCYFSSGWFFRVHLVNTETSNGTSVQLPLFCFVLTKTRFAGSSTQSLQIIEMCLNGIETIQRVNSFSDVKITLQEIQQYFVTKRSLEKFCPGQHVMVDLYLASGNQKQISDPCYSMAIVDLQHSSAKNGKFAIFIVPQGRETEWLFSSKDGQMEVATNASFERVVIVFLGRGHTFSDMDSIKKELSTKVMALAPTRFNHNTQVPFLSIGEDLGNRVVLHEGNSALSGDYVVEDVDGDSGEKFRRLIFLNNKYMIQSEARLVTDKANSKKSKGKRKKKAAVSDSSPKVDQGYLGCQHHRVIVTGLAWIEEFVTAGDPKEGLIVGLGGGGLAMFLHQHFKQLSIEVVELDPCISEIAKSWFEFKEDERIKVIIEDGFKYIETKEGDRAYDVIIFDVDSKDITVGMSSPPQAFVDRTFLTRVHSLLTPSGVFLVNLACRNTDLRDQVVGDLRAVFPELYSIGIEGEVNEIVIALPQPRYQTATEDKTSAGTLRTVFQSSVMKLQKLAKSQSHSWDPSLDLCQLVENIQIL